MSFQDLITREKNGARGGSWSPDKKSQVVSVQISSRHTKGDMGREGKIERAREKEDKLLRLDKGQNCLSALVMANANRPLLISLDLLSLTRLSCCFSVPVLSLLLTYPLCFLVPSSSTCLLLHRPLITPYLPVICPFSLPSPVPKSRTRGAAARPQSSASRLHQPRELPGCPGGGMVLT